MNKDIYIYIYIYIFTTLWHHPIMFPSGVTWQQSVNPLAAVFFIPFRGQGDNFFYKPSPDTEFFFNVYCLAQNFSLVLMFPGLRINIYLQYRESVYTQVLSVYTQLLKWRTRKFNFQSYILNLVKINISFFFKGWQSQSRFISEPSMYYQIGRFIERANLSAKRTNQTRFLFRFISQPQPKG